MTAILTRLPFTEGGFLDRTRKRVGNALFYLGDISDLAVQTIVQARRKPFEREIFVAQLDQVGVRSLSIVGITSLFIGMVLALQTAYSLADFGGKLFIGKVVSLSLIRELAPVLMALMVGGRVGAGMTAEIGTMKVTEQIDALRALATNPVRKLVVPRVLATTLMFPLLTVISCAVGIFGGLLIAIGTLHLDANFYLRSVINTVNYNGLRTTGGADGVGRSTTVTVVASAITVLILDFFLTKLFLLAF